MSEDKNKEKIEKINKMKQFIVSHSHKIDLVIGSCLIIYSIYGYFNNISYYWIVGIAGIISLVMSFIKPVRLMDKYFNKKIIRK